MRAQTKFLFAAGPILAAALSFATLGQAAPFSAGASASRIAHESLAMEAQTEKAHYTGHPHTHHHHHHHTHHHYHHKGM